MLKLAEKYGDRPAKEFPLLFQRILQNQIRDYYRRQKVRALWTSPFSIFQGSVKGGNDDTRDPLEHVAADDPSGLGIAPDVRVEQQQVMYIIESAVATLPMRQREAFLLRYWEGLDVAETAKVMGCSSGSVKTHCSRAAHTLAAMLQEQGITL